MKNLYLIIGPSGTGKITIQGILEKVWQLDGVHSYTTRTPRAEKEYGHRFVSEEAFDALYPSMTAYTEYDGHRYGVTDELIRKADFYVIDPAGAWRLAQNAVKPLYVIWLEASEKERIIRMLKRGDDIDKAYGRIVNDRYDFCKEHQESIFLAIPNHTILSVEKVSCLEAASLAAKIMMTNG